MCAVEHGADETILYPSGELDRDQQRAFSDAIKELTAARVPMSSMTRLAAIMPSLLARHQLGRALFGNRLCRRANTQNSAQSHIAEKLSGGRRFWGAFVARDPKANKQNLDDLMEMFNDGKIKPRISGRYPLEEAAKALREMSDRK